MINYKFGALHTMTDSTQPKPSDASSKPVVMTFDMQPFLVPASILISAILISASIWFSVRGLTIQSGVATNNVTVTPTVAPGATISQDKVKGLFEGNYIKFGDANSKLLLVEFGDPSCPYCHIASGKNGALNKSAGAQFTLVADGGTYVAPVTEFRKLVDEGKAAFAYVYTTGHGSGKAAMEALYCAYDNNKFWEVHDLLMSDKGYELLNTTLAKDANGNALSNDENRTVIANFVASAMDVNTLKSCLLGGKYADRVTSDESYAISTFGISGTPGFLVNTQLYNGAYSFNDMKSTVDAALQ